MGFLSKDDILKRSDLKIEVVSVPEWGGNVNIRTLTGSERDRFEASINASRIGVRGLFAALVICDEKGERIFSDMEAAALGNKGAAALDRILTEGLRLNGMTNQSIEEKEKNSEAGQKESSG